MISVGVDVSKGKSTICILKPYGEIVCSPFEMQHVEKGLDGLDSILQKLDGEIRIVMEATGKAELPGTILPVECKESDGLLFFTVRVKDKGGDGK